MPEPDWKTELRDWVESWFDPLFQARALTTLTPLIDAAYQRGLIAGRSQTGYETRRKSKEPPCAPSAGSPSPASTTSPDET